MVGTEGKVYALDADAEAIEVTKEKASTKGLQNLEFRVGRAEDEILCNNCADMIFLGNVLHDFIDGALEGLVITRFLIGILYVGDLRIARSRELNSFDIPPVLVQRARIRGIDALHLKLVR